MEQEDGLWNWRRHELRYALARIDDVLSDLYRHLIDCLAEPLTVGRLVVASHCVRELSNNLVDYLDDVEDLPEYVDGSRRRRLLASKWSEHQEVVGPHDRPLGEPPVTRSTGQGPAALVTVPRDLLEAARLVVEVETGGTDRAGSRVSALMTARVDLADSASVRLLQDSLRFFTRYVHLRHGTSIELPPWEELLRHLTRFEEALMGRVGDFFTRRNEILDLLARANQQTTVTRTMLTADRGDHSMYETPSPGLVEEVLVRTGDLQHRRVFYDGLHNPKWVRPLSEAGAFNSPPATVVDAEGYLRTTPWPEGDYLVRMAAHVPEDVASVLRSVQGNDDPYVQRTFLKAATHMPAAAVREFVPFMIPLLDGPLRRMIDPGDWVQIIATLAAGEETRSEAMRVANAVYRPRAGSVQDAPLRRQRAAIPLEDWGYGRSLPALREAMAPLGLGALRQLRIWLEEYQLHSGDFDVDRKRDFSTLTRPSIAPHEQKRGYDSVRDALIDAVRDEAESLVQKGTPTADVLDVLQRSEQPLVQRIAVHILAASTRDGVGDAVERAVDHLLDRQFLEEDFRNEYSHLARAVLPRLTSEQEDAWVRLVLEGPYESLANLERRAARYLAEGETVEFVVQRYQEVWRRDVLASIGDDLPDEAARVLEELIERWGRPAHPEFPNWMEFTEVTPKAPSESERLASMAITEVVDWLATWEPDDQARGADQPTIEKVASAIESDVRSRPLEYAAAAGVFGELDPTYVRACFSGLAEAVTDVRIGDWTPVVELMIEVAGREDGPDADVATFDRDISWQYAQREVLRLINASLETGRDTRDMPLESFADVVGRLRLNPDPTPAHEARYGGDMDPLTMSLNAVRPVAIATLADMLQYESNDESATHDPTSPTADRIRGLLEDRMGADADESFSVAAAFGRSMGKLIDTEEAWVKANLSRLLGAPGAEDNPQYSEVVISTALATHRKSGRLLRLFEDYYQSMYDRASSGESIAVGWKRDRSAIELIGDFVVELVIRGELGLDEPVVVNFFRHAPVSERSSTLGHLGWALGQADEVAESIAARAMQLINSRVVNLRAGGDASELGGFAWWALADHFPAEWWLPILELAVQATTVDSHGLMGEALEKASQADPGAAINVLELLLAQRTEPYERFGLIEYSPAVIATALDSGDEDVAERGRALMNQLGRRGEVRLAELVEDRRRRGNR